MNKYFKLSRFGLLAKHEVLTSYKMSIYFLTIVGVYTVLAILTFVTNRITPGLIDREGLNFLYPGFLFLGGYIFTSLVFNDINDKFKSSLWFTLPASSLEKYLITVLLSGIGYVIFVTLSFVLASLISNVFTQPFFRDGMNVFNPWRSFGNFRDFIYLNLAYLFTHSVYLVGSIVFKKAAFIKTSLVSSIVSIVYTVIFSAIFYIVAKSGIIDNWDVRLFRAIQDYVFDISFNNVDLINFANWIIGLGILFSAFFNVVGYFKLTEKEVKGGV